MKNKIMYLSKYTNKNSEMGNCIYNYDICFYKKIINKNKYIKEVKGYNMLRGKYKIPKRLYFDNNIIIYERRKELIKNTIHEVIYFSNKRINIKKILEQYSCNLNERIIVSERDTNANTFFQGRLNIIEEYQNSSFKEYIYFFKNEEVNFLEILKDIIYNIKKDKKLTSFFTQGDPTDTNMSPSGYFTDFENAGLNTIVSEIAILFVSLTTHGSYFYPKYNSGAYSLRKKILKNIEKNRPYFVFNKMGDNIYLNFKFDINLRAKLILKEYLNMLKRKLNENEIEEINKYLKFYICFRILTPLKITNMKIEDALCIISICIYCYNNINSIDFIIDKILE